VHRVAFDIFSFPVHWFGILIVLGFISGIWTASRRGMRDGIAPAALQDLGLWLLLGGIGGARALYVISYWREEFADKPWTEIFMVQHGGLVFYGGLIGATIAAVIFVRNKGLPLWKVADALAPSISLGSVFGRLGCFMNGCCYGRPTCVPWAVSFPPDHPTKGVNIHPTQIYDSLLNLGLYLGLAWLYRRKKFDGQVFAAYLVGYALSRSFVELFRGDYPVRYFGDRATPAQLVSGGILLVGLLLFWMLSRIRRG
jgi:phosphatidylglycerol:prolipoprotein diacylglycerol transferase